MNIPQDWTFQSVEVAENFDYHVREQLPWYDLATNMVAHIARHFIPEYGLIYDIGASTGNIGKAIQSTVDYRKAIFIPIEKSENMCRLYSGPGSIECSDALQYNYDNFDLAILFLTLMFIAPGARKALVKRLVDKINPGGAIIIFDKTAICGTDSYLATILHRLTLSGKLATGTPPDQIIAKELSLSGVQRPLSYKWIETITPRAIEVFRYGEFAGWIIERPE